jgi:inorganic pyrophosphatase
MAEIRLTCVIEIPKGSRNKYEYDSALGAIKLDRFVSASVVYPTDYGFVPRTLAPDGDPLDVLVCVSEATFPGCLVPAKPIGVFKMEDEKGPDDHLVCVPLEDPGWNTIEDIGDMPEQVRAEITTSSRCTRTSIRIDDLGRRVGTTAKPPGNSFGRRGSALTTVRSPSGHPRRGAITSSATNASKR